jgi:hypothetical protein
MLLGQDHIVFLLKTDSFPIVAHHFMVIAKSTIKNIIEISLNPILCLALLRQVKVEVLSFGQGEVGRAHPSPTSLSLRYRYLQRSGRDPTSSDYRIIGCVLHRYSPKRTFFFITLSGQQQTIPTTSITALMNRLDCLDTL